MQKKTVYVLGDSIAIHYGPFLQKMINGKYNYDYKGSSVKKSDGVEEANDANGGDSRQVLQHLADQYIKKTRYDILLLNCGLHDVRTDRETRNHQVSEKEYGMNLRKIIYLAKEISDKIYWISTTPVVDTIHNSRKAGFLRFNRDVLLYNSIAEKIMKEYDVPVIDLYTFTKSLGEHAYIDHVHFNEDARSMQAAFITGCLYSLKQVSLYRKNKFVFE